MRSIRRRLPPAMSLPAWGGNPTYIEKIVGLFGANLIQYLPFDDAAGSATARDASGNSRPGANTDITAGSTPLGTGHTSYSFNGSSSIVNPFSAGLAGAYSDALVSIGFFYKGVGSWTAGEYFMEYRYNATNRWMIYTNATGVTFGHRTEAETVSVTSAASHTNVIHLMVTLNGTNMIAYLNGAPVDTRAYTTWGQALTYTRIGSFAGSNFLDGNFSDVITLDRVATPVEVAICANPF